MKLQDETETINQLKPVNVRKKATLGRKRWWCAESTAQHTQCKKKVPLEVCLQKLVGWSHELEPRSAAIVLISVITRWENVCCRVEQSLIKEKQGERTRAAAWEVSGRLSGRANSNEAESGVSWARHGYGVSQIYVCAALCFLLLMEEETDVTGNLKWIRKNLGHSRLELQMVGNIRNIRG